MVEMTNKKIIAIVAVVVVVVAALAIVFVVNGHSLDIRDRSTRIVVTESMDGSEHPSGCYHCTVCDRDWLPDDIGSLTKDPVSACPYGCASPTSVYVSHNYSIEKIPVNALIVIKSLSNSEKNDLKVGDVISFYNSGTHLETVHRIVQITKDSSGNVLTVKTSGDNDIRGTGFESPTLDEIHGVVVGESVILGKIVHFAQSSTLLLVMMLVIIVVIISVIRDMFKMSQHNKNQ